VANLSVGVNVDFTGVTYTPGTGWSGTPAWTITPSNLVAHQGNNKIAWSLTTLNSNQQNTVPSGFTAAFSSTSGVVFKASNPTPWTGSTPTLQTTGPNSGQITADDNFQNLAVSQTFNYTTSVSLTPNAGNNGVGTTFSYDPDVENDSGGGVITYAAAGEAAGV
jgi:hypothetical protein